MGCYKGDRSYLANGWNFFDFLIVFLTTVFVAFRHLDFTILRFVRLIEKFEGILNFKKI